MFFFYGNLEFSSNVNITRESSETNVCYTNVVNIFSLFVS